MIYWHGQCIAGLMGYSTRSSNRHYWLYNRGLGQFLVSVGISFSVGTRRLTVYKRHKLTQKVWQLISELLQNRTISQYTSFRWLLLLTLGVLGRHLSIVGIRNIAGICRCCVYGGTKILVQSSSHRELVARSWQRTPLQMRVQLP